MKLEIERQDFLKAWQTTEKLASQKSTNDSLKGVLITASDDNTVRLEATDLSTSIRCKAKGANVIEPGRAVLPAALFGGMLKKLDSDDFVLEVNSTRGLINAGSKKMRFTVISPEEFPNIPTIPDTEAICEISAPVLSKVITEGVSAASLPQDFPKYLGTCLLRTAEMSLVAVSTDGKRLSLSKALCNAFRDEELLLPAPALKDFAKNIASLGDEANVRILADESIAWFVLEDTEYSLRRIDSAFPKFERILNNECYTTLHINSGELTSALERIDIIASKTVSHIMSMSLSPSGELRITARAPELGTAREILQANIEGGELHLGFNVGYFMDGLKAVGNNAIAIEFSGMEGQTRLKREGSEDFLYMLMPARLSTQDAITDEESADFTSTASNPQPQQEDTQQQEDTPGSSEQDTPF